MAVTNPFPHIRLKMIRDASKKKRQIVPKKSPQTSANLKNRRHHAKTLETSVNRVNLDWQANIEDRKANGYPDLPEAISLFLKVDPKSTLVESLRSFGIEIVGELEEGYIIGASADLTLSDLAAKIKKFAQAGQNNVAELWEIINGNSWRIEHILSPTLAAQWPLIRDDDQFVLEAGIACIGMDELPRHPEKRQKNYPDEERYQQAVKRWHEKRDAIYEKWDELAYERYQLLVKLVANYNGEILSAMIEGNLDSASQLPDSFTCKLRLNGKGLRDFVLNYPYLFDLVEAEEVEVDADGSVHLTLNNSSSEEVIIKPPDREWPRVCVIDSGIQERHPLLQNAINSIESCSWIDSPTDVADYVAQGGHGTRVAGAVLYPRDIPQKGTYQLPFWIQNARVLDNDNRMPEELFPPSLLPVIVERFHTQISHTKIFNHSINSTAPSRKVHMSAWAAAMDKLSWENDIVFIASAGNLPKTGNPANPGIREKIAGGDNYPEYLYQPWARIANPAQSLQAITVGSIAIESLRGPVSSLAEQENPSSFSRAGLGIWNSIKPELVEYGGDFATDNAKIPSLTVVPEIAPELVRSTMHGGARTGRDKVGTSFAAPKVAHVVAAVQEILPHEPALLYRALVIQSARWPQWTSSISNKLNVLRSIGYGLPDQERATNNSPHRITLITSGEVYIRAGQVHIYEVTIPQALRRPGDAYTILMEVTLSYKAEPRRTRRTKNRYLSTWLEWQSSKLNEPSDVFMRRMIELAGSDGVESEDVNSGASDAGTVQWMLRERNDWGEIKGVNRNNSTVQKDWVQIKSHDFADTFSLAVIGHAGWHKDGEATVPYSLVVSFEAINQDIEIYSEIAVANEIVVESEQEVRIHLS